ncbi:MAG: CopG family transcriptional regulator [Oscillospiraceae bacterium]|nr:CopG family transcriptional regulator [Oscillospiraceae bacterium]MBR6836512.1 CopG family transcriptional regulator [Oscillospiraceae bacterium]
MDGKLLITKKSNIKGYDGYKTFSIRIKEETAEKLDEISLKTNRSRNELINLLLDYGITNCEIKE